MKKVIIILAIILTIGISAFVINKIYKSNTTYYYEEIFNENKNIDDGLNKLMESEEYKNSNENKKIEVVENFLKLYEKDNIIKNLDYDSKTKLFSFQYSDGSLGGVSLKEFDPMLN